jgi:hypothetical protein
LRRFFGLDWVWPAAVSALAVGDDCSLPLAFESLDDDAGSIFIPADSADPVGRSSEADLSASIAFLSAIGAPILSMRGTSAQTDTTSRVVQISWH